MVVGDSFYRLRYPLKYADLIKKYSRSFKLEPNFVAAVIYEESRFQKDSVSNAGAMGLMQIMPETAEHIASNLGETVSQEQLFDPEFNIRYGCWYLRFLLDHFDGDPVLALAAYNAGISYVKGWQEKGQGIVFKETKVFVKRVEKSAMMYKKIYHW